MLGLQLAETGIVYWMGLSEYRTTNRAQQRTISYALLNSVCLRDRKIGQNINSVGGICIICDVFYVVIMLCCDGVVVLVDDLG